MDRGWGKGGGFTPLCGEGFFRRAVWNRGLVKHIDGDIWELRPAKDRVLFVVMKQGKFLLLHAFTKKTVKTPKREIEKAKAEYKDYIERGLDKDE
jgi:phage-related protein